MLLITCWVSAARPQSAKAARWQERRVSVCCENKLLINSGNNPNEENGGVVACMRAKDKYLSKIRAIQHPSDPPTRFMALHEGPGPRRGRGQSVCFRGCCRFLLLSETLELLRVVLGSLLGGIFIWVSGSDKRKLLIPSSEFLP